MRAAESAPLLRRSSLLRAALASVLSLGPRLPAFAAPPREAAWSAVSSRAEAIDATLGRVPAFVVGNARGEPYLTEVDAAGRRWGSVFLTPRDAASVLEQVRAFDREATLVAVPLSTVYSEIGRTASEAEALRAAAPQPRESTTSDLRLLQLRPLSDEQPPEDVGELPGKSAVPLYFEPSLLISVEGEERRPYFFRYGDLTSTWKRAGVKGAAPNVRLLSLEKLLGRVADDDSPPPLLMPASDTAEVLRLRGGVAAPPPRPAWPATPAQAALHLPLLLLPSAAAAVALPQLYETYRAAPPAENFGPLLGVLLTKRVALYASAGAAVFVAALRSSDAEPGLGERLERVTADALRPAQLPEGQAAEVAAVTKRLDAAPQSAQAAALPLVFLALLVSAYAGSVLLGAPPPADEPPPVDLAAIARAVLPLSTASTCAFAVNAEVQACAAALAPGSESEAPEVAAAAVAVALVAFAYSQPLAVAWPAQNFVNACVALSVSRVLQLPSLPAVLAAVGGLALYDGVGTIVLSAPAADSLMEGVAMSKVGDGGGLWQPGLLTVVLNGRVSDGLGLGDVVAPSLLAGWARRRDLDVGGGGFLAAAMGGFAAGCVALEVAPPELSRAALLFLIPATAASLIGRLLVLREA